jgi:hypothetical protein
MTDMLVSSTSIKSIQKRASVNGPLNDEIFLSDNGNIIFHWADFFESCEYIKQAIQSQHDLKQDFDKKEKVLKRLNLIPVWIRGQKKVIQTTMYNLYEHAILNRFNLVAHLEIKGDIELSFISSTGPFKLMPVSECFNKDTYKDFVMVYLLRDKLPRRDFRLRLKSKVLVQSGHNQSLVSLLGIEQLTMSGILFSINADEYAHFLSKQTEIKFLIDSVVLGKSIGKNLSELRDYLSQFAFNLFYSSRNEDSIICHTSHISVQSSFDFHLNNKIFLFVHYDHLKGVAGFDINLLKDFVSHARHLIRQNYQLSADLKMA